MPTKMTYGEQLKHPNWQKRRLEVLNAAGFKCLKCGDTEKTLHVHHKQYIKGRKAWEYELTNFEALCEDCHETTHTEKTALDTIIAALPSSKWPEAASLLAAYFYDECDHIELHGSWIDPYAYEVGLLAGSIARGDFTPYDVIHLSNIVADCPKQLRAFEPHPDGEETAGPGARS